MTFLEYKNINDELKRGIPKDKILTITNHDIKKNTITLSNGKSCTINEFVFSIKSKQICVKNPSKIKYWDGFTNSLKIGDIVEHQKIGNLTGFVKEKVSNSKYIIHWIVSDGSEFDCLEHFESLKV